MEYGPCIHGPGDPRQCGHPDCQEATAAAIGGVEASKADEALVLTENEAAVLALRLVIQQAENAEEWLLWENLPMLAEGSFEALSGWVDVVANRLRKDLRSRERDSGIDTTALLERSR